MRTSDLYVIPDKLRFENWVSASFYSLSFYPVLYWAKNCALFCPMTLWWSCAWLPIKFALFLSVSVLWKPSEEVQLQKNSKREKSVTLWHSNFNILAKKKKFMNRIMIELWHQMKILLNSYLQFKFHGTGDTSTMSTTVKLCNNEPKSNGNPAIVESFHWSLHFLFYFFV